MPDVTKSKPAFDPLHPTGKCRCAGEGKCEWCTTPTVCGCTNATCPGCGADEFDDDPDVSQLVVHKHKAHYDVYIGRPSKWGNPFSHKAGTLAQYRVASREEAIARYREWAAARCCSPASATTCITCPARLASRT